MDEKKLISLTDDIVDAIVDISIGRGKMKAVMPGTITKKLVNDETLFLRLKKLWGTEQIVHIKLPEFCPKIA